MEFAHRIKGRIGAPMKKIGIMGGTFNPIHYAHLILAENAFEQYSLDEVIFLPSRKPAYKPLEDIVEDEHRKNMVMLAIKDNPHFTISTMEFDREGNTYTADTLTLLSEQYPDDTFYFIIGGDSLFQLEKWYNFKTVLKLSHILAAGRDDTKEDEIQNKIAELNSKYNAKISYLRVPSMEISSKMIRDRIYSNETVQYFLPDNVLHYIKEKNLYSKNTKI